MKAKCTSPLLPYFHLPDYTLFVLLITKYISSIKPIIIRYLLDTYLFYNLVR